jgi:hypothetical protein
VATEIELLEAVDAAFEITGRGLASWPDPHPDRSPLDEEYSRVVDPYKWRIVGARADAWLAAAAQLGLAALQPHAQVQWAARPSTAISRTDRAVPHAAGALPLVVARSRVGDVDDAGVTSASAIPRSAWGGSPTAAVTPATAAPRTYSTTSTPTCSASYPARSDG